MKISTKLGLGFAIILIVTVVISILSYGAMGDYSQAVEKITGVNIPTITRSQRRALLVTEANVAQTKLFYVNTAEEREEVKKEADGYFAEFIKLVNIDLIVLKKLQNKGFDRKKEIAAYEKLIKEMKRYKQDFSHLVNELNKDVEIRGALVKSLDDLGKDANGMAFKQEFKRKNFNRTIGDVAEIQNRQVKFKEYIYRVVYEPERRKKSAEKLKGLTNVMSGNMDMLVQENPTADYSKNMKSYLELLKGFKKFVDDYLVAVAKVEAQSNKTSKDLKNKKDVNSDLMKKLEKAKRDLFGNLGKLDTELKMVHMGLSRGLKSTNFGINTTKTIVKNILNLKLSNIKYQLDRNEEEYEILIKNIDESTRLLKFVAIKAESEDEKYDVEKLSDAFLAYQKEVAEWKDFIVDVENNLLIKMNASIDSIHKVSNSEIARIEELTASEVLNMDLMSKKATFIIESASGAALVFGIIVAIVLIRSIIRPIRFVELSIEKLAEHLNGVVSLMETNLAQGDWSEKAELRIVSENRQRLEVFAKRKDEIGQMCRAEVDIITRIVAFVDAINDVIDQVNNALGEVVDTVEQVTNGAGQVSGASHALSEGATSQAASLEEITSSVTELSSKVNDNATNATEAQKLSEQAVKVGDEGTTKMGGLVDKMEVINQSTVEINKVIKTIDDIAFQTNLLALNAAVEAARAGQHGKGFAVVAEEVRNLAARSAKAAGETADMIDEVVRNITEGHSMAGEAAQVLEEIVGFTSKVTVLNSEVAEASNEQAQGVAQINIGLSQVDQVTQSNTASAEETASAAQQMNSLANYLKEVANKFKLAEREEDEIADYDEEDDAYGEYDDALDKAALPNENDQLLLE